MVKTPPGPRTLLPLGHLRPLQRDPIGFFLQLKDYGDIARFRIGPQAVYFLNHPDLIKDVLVTNHHKFMKSRALQRAKRVLGEGLLTSKGASCNRPFTTSASPLTARP